MSYDPGFIYEDEYEEKISADGMWRYNSDGIIECLQNIINNETVCIPSIIDGTKITHIGSFIFNNWCKLQEEQIKNLYIDEGIKTIGRDAFRNIKINTLHIPYSLEIVGEYAFNNCGIYDIPVPSGDRWSDFSNLRYLCHYAFENNHLSDYHFATDVCCFGKACLANNPLTYENLVHLSANYKYDSFVFANTEMKYIMISEHDYNGVTIEDGMFAYCKELSGTITFPKTLTKIKKFAFLDCSNITKIIFENPDVEIEPYAFHNATGLKEVVYPNGVKHINTNCFTKGQVNMLYPYDSSADPLNAEPLNIQITLNR